MICPKCGGQIHADADCDRCGIGYDEMLDSIEHDEMKRIFIRINDLISNHEGIDIELSLLACELRNSSLLFPVRKMDGGSVGIVAMTLDGRRNFIPLFKDRKECEKCIDEGDIISTAPFDVIISLLDSDVEGFVINAGSKTNGGLTRDFLKQYFPKAWDAQK